MNLENMAEKYRDAGYSEQNADARVCQDTGADCNSVVSGIPGRDGD